MVIPALDYSILPSNGLISVAPGLIYSAVTIHDLGLMYCRRLYCLSENQGISPRAVVLSASFSERPQLLLLLLLLLLLMPPYIWTFLQHATACL